jgi:hypothetical protein
MSRGKRVSPFQAQRLFHGRSVFRPGRSERMAGKSEVILGLAGYFRLARDPGTICGHKARCARGPGRC